MASKVSSADIEKWYKNLNMVRTQSGIGLSSISEATFTKKQTTDRTTALLENILKTRSDNQFLNTSDYNVESSNIEDGKSILEYDKDSIQNAVTSLLRICPNLSCKTVCNNTGINSNQLNSNGNCQNGYNTNGSNNNGELTHGTNSNVVKENGVNSNNTNSNGSKLNTVNRNGTNSNGKNTKGSCSYGTEHICITTDGDGDGTDDWCHYGTCTNGYNSKGTCNYGIIETTNSKGTHSKGTQQNGTNSNEINSNVALINGTHSQGICQYGGCIFGKNNNVIQQNGCTDSIYDPNTVAYSHKDYYSIEQAEKRGES